MRWMNYRCLRSAMILTAFFLVGCTPVKRLYQVAEPASHPTGAPKYSDVCFSSRVPHPKNSADSLDTFRAAAQFHATYLNWVYTTDAGFIRKADSLGLKVQVTLSPTLPDLSSDPPQRNTGRILDAEGKKVSAPWMQGWGYWWGCVNHPDFRQLWLTYIRNAIDAGAHGFQVDDPAFSQLFLRNKWADVCYCEHCKAKADSLGMTPPEIQEQSVVDFHRWAKQQANAYAGREVPFSCNNFRGEWELFPFDEFAYGVAELPERRANPEYIYASLRETRRRGKAQVFSFANDRAFLTEKVIATVYACGGNPLVPWDVWMGSGKDRYYGKPEDFAPLFGFARAIAPWLDGYEDAFYANTQDEFRYTDVRKLPVFFRDYRRQIHAFVRAKPGEHHAPVVVHLVDWEVLTQPFDIFFNEKAFFKSGIGRIELLVPKVYEESEHELAQKKKDFSSLVMRSELQSERGNNKLKVTIPAIERSWAVLVLYPGRP
ncbi:MAG: hypothetical protein D6816_19735 [Bacteroidetes bacterium]|nr:MAG: hypothetical protein D6816_19735 [Bacteroidota bacterium]